MGRVAIAAVVAWSIACVLAGVLTVVALLVAGRGMSRLDWVLPLLATSIVATFLASAVAVGLACWRSLESVIARAVVVVTYLIACAATLVPMTVLILLSFNR